MQLNFKLEVLIALAFATLATAAPAEDVRVAPRSRIKQKWWHLATKRDTAFEKIELGY